MLLIPSKKKANTFCPLWQKLDEAACPTSKTTCVYIRAVQIGQLISNSICIHQGQMEATQFTLILWQIP